MTLPPWYRWFPIGERLCIPYQAPQGRRVNALGAYFSHGPLSGHFVFHTWAALPKNKSQKPRKTPTEIAAAHGLSETEVGAIDAPRLLAFLWETAGRPGVYADGWKRVRPLVIVLDNYSVHKSQIIQEALAALEAADVFLLYLPS